MHFEHHVPLVCGPLHFPRKVVWREGRAPRRGCDAVAQLLPEQLVGGHFQVLAHCIVHRAAERGVQRVVHELERALADEAFEERVGRPLPSRFDADIAVSLYAVVGDYAGDQAVLDARNQRLAVVQAFGNRGLNLDKLDVGDFHGESCG